MPRKSTAAELQAEEAAVSSPLRRSSRIVYGNGTTPAGVATRRSSQTSETQASTPGRVTRGRRASAQDSEEKVEGQPAKPVTRTRRASVLAEEEAQKETPSTPSRRTRKPSVTTEPTEKDVYEKSKPVRRRRTSSASTIEEPDEQKPPKTAQVRGRRSSANAELETEVKIGLKTPARATTRRRSSAAEHAVVDVSTPAKRTTRGRKASDAEEISVTTEEDKKPTVRSRRNSVNQEDGKNEELVKPAGRRSRKTSTDESLPNTATKTGGLERRPSNQEVGSENFVKDDKNISEMQDTKTTNDGNDTEEEMSPITLRDVSVKVTPLKKRKIIDKVEAELDLSVINESSDDIDNSKHDELSIERTERVNKKERSELIQSGSPQTPFKEDCDGITPVDGSSNSAGETNSEPVNTSSNVLNMSSGSPRSTPSSKNRSYTENDDNPSPRKSPRLTEKLSRSNTPKEGWEHKKLPTPRKPRNLMKENEIITDKPQSSFVSSGSDGSFKFHLSNISIANSGQHDSNKDDFEDDLLNSSKESTGSNKENIEQLESLNIGKAILDVSEKLPVQESIVVSRVSSVFKSNQKDYSFTEPMEVDEDSIMCSESFVIEENTKLDNTSLNLNSRLPEKVLNVHIAKDSSDCPTKIGLDLKEPSVEFNYKASLKKNEEKFDDSIISQISSTQQKETETVKTLESATNAIQPNLLETEGSDTNLIIEETQYSVDFSIQPKTTKTEIQSPFSTQESKSQAGSNASLIINQPLEQVKVVLLGKSSSPIVARQKSKSPVSRAANSTAREHDVPRRSKSRSKSPSMRSGARSPGSMIGNMLSTENKAKSRQSLQTSDALIVPQRSKSKSKSPSPRRSSVRSPSFLCVDVDDQVKSRKCKSPVGVAKKAERSDSRSPRPKRSSTKSPSCLCVDMPNKVNSLKSKSPAARDVGSKESIRSKSKSPKPRRSSTKSPGRLCVDIFKPTESKESDRSKSNSLSPDFQETPVTQDGRKFRKSVRSTSKSPVPDSQEFLNDRNLSPTKFVKTNLKSPLTGSQGTLINQDGENVRSKRSIRSKSKSPLPCFQSPVAQDKLIISRPTRSKSKSPLPEYTVLEHSFEKTKGSEEIIVFNEKISVEPSKVAKDENPSLIHLPDSISTNFGTTAESQFEISDINTSVSERSNIQDKTEYHTAIATTNNESDYTSVLNTDEVTPSQIKNSELIHYDFDLDSDDDDLFHSNESKSVASIETGILDKRTLALQKELLTELKKSFLKSKISEDKHKINESVIDKEKPQEKSKIKVLGQVNSGGFSNSDKSDNKEEESDSYVQKDEENILASTKNNIKDTLENQSTKINIKNLLTEESITSTLDKQSKDTHNTIITIDTNKDNDDIANDTDLTTTRKIANVHTTEDNINDEIVLVDSKEICGERNEKNIFPEQAKDTIQHNISNECPMDESQVDAVDIKDRVDLRTELHKIDESIHEKTGEMISTSEDVISVNDETEEECLKKNDREHNNSIEEFDDEDDSKKPKKKSQNKKHKAQKEDSKSNEVTTGKIATLKGDKSQSNHTNSINKSPKVNEDSNAIKNEPSLDEFASSKLEEYLNSKADELEESSSEGEDEENESETDDEEKESEAEDEEASEAEYNEFIDGMAEEGEEDTPSEDSNQIIDEGESIGYSSDDQLSEDDYDSNDSFICDEEELALSGEEYDLDNEKQKKKKKSRIIDLSTLNDCDIIKIPRKKKEQEKPKTRSRIITVSDSSDEEQEATESGFEIKEKCLKEDEENAKKDQSVDGSVILIEESTQHEEHSDANLTDEPKTTDTSKPIVIEESNYENASEAVVTTEDSKVVDSSKEKIVDKSHVEDINDFVVTEESNHESVRSNLSLDNLNTSLQKRNKKSSLSIQENILVNEVKNPLIRDEENTKKDESVDESVILIEESAQYEQYSNADLTDESKMTDTSKPIVIKESNDENASEAVITTENSKVVDSSKEKIVDTSHVKEINDFVVTEESNNEYVRSNLLDNLNTSLQKRNRKSSLSIQENILVDGVKNPLISERINTLVESFCSTVKHGEISLNLSLEYEDTPQEKDKQTVHVISDIKTYNSKPIVFQVAKEETNEITDFKDVTEQKESKPSVTLIEAGDLREVLNKKNLKRKLSKSVDDICKEVKQTKRRKTHKVEKDKKKTASNETPKTSTKKTKKREKMHKDLRKEVQSTISSFSIMNQLITDVKSRPKRTIKPTKTDAEVENSWSTTKTTNLKPSTSPVTKGEKIKIKPKLHPKDFKNQMLCDEKRVKRIDTKTLLKKKGAFY